MKWANRAKCAVCLTFDFDAEVSWRSILRRHGIERDNPVVLSQGKYGPQEGVPRILRLLKRHDVEACFYVPGIVAEQYSDLTIQIAEEGHEIGHHGYTHTNPARQSLDEEREEMIKGIRVLEELTGKRPICYRAPAADLSENTHRLLMEFDIMCDSSMMDRDSPYLINNEHGTLVELPFKWYMDDWVHFGFNYFPPLEYQSGISSHRKVLDIWLDEFEACYEEGLYLMLVMHPQITGVPSRVKMLERFIRRVKEHGDVWIATPSEIAAFCRNVGADSR